MDKFLYSIAGSLLTFCVGFGLWLLQQRFLEAKQKEGKLEEKASRGEMTDVQQTEIIRVLQKEVSALQDTLRDNRGEVDRAMYEAKKDRLLLHQVVGKVDVVVHLLPGVLEKIATLPAPQLDSDDDLIGGV